MSKGSAPTDALMAEILANIDEKRYRAATRPSWMRFGVLWSVLKVLWRLRGSFWNMLWAFLSPERAYRGYQRKVDAYQVEFTENLIYALSLAEFRQTYVAPMARQIFGVSMPALIAALVAQGSVNRVVGRKPAEAQALSDKLQLGFTGDIVVEMGIALFRLAKLLDPSDFEDLSRLAERVHNRQMP